jgi:hypothetical protein
VQQPPTHNHQKTKNSSNKAKRNSTAKHHQTHATATLQANSRDQKQRNNNSPQTQQKNQLSNAIIRTKKIGTFTRAKTTKTNYRTKQLPGS